MSDTLSSSTLKGLAMQEGELTAMHYVKIPINSIKPKTLVIFTSLFVNVCVIKMV